MQNNNDIILPEIERLLNEGHMVEFMPQWESMRPFIEGGHDRVILKSCNNPKLGHIVLARINDSYVLHRIYQIKGKHIILQGDGNLIGQEICTAVDIIGRVVHIRSKGRKYKRVTTAQLWRHLPIWCKKIILKIYRKVIQYN